jgi:glutaredoxin-related protein
MLFNFDLERTLAGWPTIDQLYIPNLKGKARGALEIVRQKIITTDRFGF